MVSVPAVKLIAPWHPNVLAEVTFPVHQGKGLEPVVRELPIRYGSHSAMGEVRKMITTEAGHVVVADTNFRISTLSSSTEPWEVVGQDEVKAKTGNVWAGLSALKGGAISATSGGTVTFHPSPSTSNGEGSSSSSASASASLPSPLTCVATSSSSSTSFAIAGKEVDVSIWDAERVFSSSGESFAKANGKRKKNELEHGEVWRAKNIPNDKLNLRPPIHHLSVTYLRDSSTDLVSGTRAGSVRRFDTRQRKPVWDKKVARDGGIGVVESGHAPHELFFGDGSSLLGAMDLRTGGLLYSFPSNSTIVSLHSIPPPPSSSAEGAGDASATQSRDDRRDGDGERIPGLASISADGTLRTYLTSPPPVQAVQNAHFAPRGKKGEVTGMYGGIARGTFIVQGWGELDVELPASEETSRRKGRAREEDEEEDDDEEEDEEEGDEEVWEGMDEVDEDSDDEGPAKTKKRR